MQFGTQIKQIWWTEAKSVIQSHEFYIRGPINMLVSVIIPTYNSLRVLKKTLPAILQQKTENRFKFEIILINDGKIWS